MQIYTELSKIRDPQNKLLINKFLTEALCFEEFVYLMGEDVPACFGLAKCWEEETGETVTEVSA